METTLAVFFITVLFLCVFQVAHMVTVKVLLDHAAARAARAKAVGFNDWMCLKAARVAVLPVSGRRLWPDGDELDEAARVPIYLSTENEAMARGILEYERWDSLGLKVSPGGGIGSDVAAAVSLGVPRFYLPDGVEADEMRLGAESRVEAHYPLYMNNQGF